MMWPLPYSREEQLTGRMRLRVGGFGRVIAQLEVRCVKKPWPPHVSKEERVSFYWRDAQRDDVTFPGTE